MTLAQAHDSRSTTVRPLVVQSSVYANTKLRGMEISRSVFLIDFVFLLKFFR